MDRFGINKLYPLPLTGAVLWTTDETAWPIPPYGLKRQWLYRIMRNDWGLSVLHGPCTYSDGTLGDDATFEVALVRFDGFDQFEVVLDDVITGEDVLGHQTLDEIRALIGVLAAQPAPLHLTGRSVTIKLTS